MLPRVVKNNLIVLLSFIPSRIASIPYYIVIYLLKYLLPSNIKLWYRNSLYFSNVCFGISDIDLTLYYQNGGGSNIQIMINKLKGLKKYIPIIGEVNIYTSSDIGFVEKIINPFELDRDPLLKRNISSRLKTREAKIVFLFRMLKSDLQGLANYPKARQRKWRQHFLDTEMKTYPIMNLKEIKEKIFSYFCFELSDQGIMNEFFNSDHSKEYLCQKYKESNRKRTYLVFFTVEWIGYSIANRTFYDDLKLIQKCSLEEKLIICENLKWELFGVYTQYLFSNDTEDFRHHVGLLFLVAEKINNTELTDVFNKLDTII
jgi:hypothetical protein